MITLEDVGVVKKCLGQLQNTQKYVRSVIEEITFSYKSDSGG